MPAAGAWPGPAGGGGLLRLLWWQAPTIMNPHLSTGTKDSDGSRIFYEPLADFDTDGNMIAVLAAEVPSLDNGGVSADGLSVTWKLRDGVTWHDGEAFDADDVVFTWEYASNEATAAVTIGNFANVDKVEAVDDTTVKITFKQQNPAWFDVFTGPNGMILPRHVFGDFAGEKSRDAEANLAPVGTGPFKLKEFRAGDTIWADRYEDYWDAGKPYFDSVEMKGGGDAQGAARAVLQSSEADWAWNLQVEPAVLAEMEGAGVGTIDVLPGQGTERLMINQSDPNTEVDGQRSHFGTPHPVFADVRARKALALACQRDVIAEQLYGKAGVAATNQYDVPEKFTNPDLTWEYNLDEAKALLDEMGFSGADIVYQTSINSVRQKTQEIIKQSLEQLGFSVQIKSVDAAVYFSTDQGNPDTAGKFYADLEMHTNGSDPYPATWFQRYRTDQIAQKENAWASDNYFRYSNPEFDKMHDQCRIEMDPDAQVTLFQDMMKLVTETDVVEVPLVNRFNTAAKANRVKGYTGSAWASNPIHDLKNWTLED